VIFFRGTLQDAHQQTKRIMRTQGKIIQIEYFWAICSR
jgi:hypothetical protein